MATSRYKSLFGILSPHREEGEKKVGGLSDRTTAEWARGGEERTREKIKRTGEEESMVRREKIRGGRKKWLEWRD